ncbi:MAG: DUF262 domain-containing protein [Nitrospira sp.]|nr:DUF262 domain-containing protein [Nitrospira sp.]
MQRYLNTTNRSIVWFKKAFEAGDLVIKPPFQRNPVWSQRQQSSLIDTILLEYPIPEIYMQEITESDGTQKHILVDGQQRIRAVLDYLAGEFELEEESPRWAGMAFEDLGGADKKKIYEYSFIVRLLPDIPDEEIRAIFQRLNRNTMTLNAQELRHATYWGPFIKLMEDLSDHEFWNESGLFSANDRRRMLDVEFISELAVAYLNGIQNKKKKLEEHYQQYDAKFEEAENVRTVFLKTLGEIEQLLPNLSKTRWSKKSDFYTLFVFLAGRSSQLPLSADKRRTCTELLADFASKVDAVIREELSQEEKASKHVADYVKNVQRAASDLATRSERNRVLQELLSSVFIVKSSR